MTSSEDRILRLADKIRRFRAEGADKTLSERDTNVLLLSDSRRHVPVTRRVRMVR